MSDEQKQNRMLHAIKKVAYARHQLDEALDELAKEIIRDNADGTVKSSGN